MNFNDVRNCRGACVIDNLEIQFTGISLNRLENWFRKKPYIKLYQLGFRNGIPPLAMYSILFQ